MPARLKYVDPTESPGWFSRAYAAFSNTRLGRFLSIKIVWRVDPLLMRVTGGRLGLDLTIPTALLETRGARSGALRRNVVIYFNDGDKIHHHRLETRPREAPGLVSQPAGQS